MIELKNIHKEYNNNVVLKDFNYRFEQGKLYILKGPSGSGKTTLLNIISNIGINYEGDYLFNGKNVEKMDDLCIGYILQQSLLFFDLSIYENLRLVSAKEDDILYYCKLFNINHLLNKYPFELSGGERQRISIIRSILTSDKIILADEPTASLDKDNAKIIAQEFNQLKSLNKLVIIASHDDYFDIFADEIIYIEDGAIKKTICNLKTNQIRKNVYLNNNKSNFNNIDKKYISYRIAKKQFRRGSLILGLMLTILIILLGIKDNCRLEFMKILEKNYPINTFSISRNDIAIFNQKIPLKIYENYNYISSNLISFYILPKQEDSIFKGENNLLAGSFPQSKEEILVSYKVYEILFGSDNLYNHLNETIIIDGMEFVITGIISNEKSSLDIVNSSNPYYDISENDLVALSFEDNLKNFGKIKNGDIVFVSCNNLYSKNYIDEISNLNFISYWEDRAKSYSYNIDLVFNIYVIILIFILIIVFIFMYNETSLRLFVRKREIGYLQIFRISKKRIKKFLILEFCYRFLKSIFVSIILTLIIFTILQMIYGIYCFPHFATWLLCIIGFTIYIVLMIYLPIRKILKKNIIELII